MKEGRIRGRKMRPEPREVQEKRVETRRGRTASQDVRRVPKQRVQKRAERRRRDERRRVSGCFVLGVGGDCVLLDGEGEGAGGVEGSEMGFSSGVAGGSRVSCAGGIGGGSHCLAIFFSMSRIRRMISKAISPVVRFGVSNARLRQPLNYKTMF